MQIEYRWLLLLSKWERAGVRSGCLWSLTSTGKRHRRAAARALALHRCLSLGDPTVELGKVHPFAVRLPAISRVRMAVLCPARAGRESSCWTAWSADAAGCSSPCSARAESPRAARSRWSTPAPGRYAAGQRRPATHRRSRLASTAASSQSGSPTATSCSQIPPVARSRNGATSTWAMRAD